MELDIPVNHDSGGKTEFKLIIAGGRDFKDETTMVVELMELAERLGDGLVISIVSGMANGADRLGYQFAVNNQIQVHEFPADWEGLGKRAGYVRNAEMGQFADGALVFWDGASRGTTHMIDTMIKLGKPVHVVNY